MKLGRSGGVRREAACIWPPQLLQIVHNNINEICFIFIFRESLARNSRRRAPLPPWPAGSETASGAKSARQYFTDGGDRCILILMICFIKISQYLNHWAQLMRNFHSRCSLHSQVSMVILNCVADSTLAFCSLALIYGHTFQRILMYYGYTLLSPKEKITSSSRPFIYNCYSPASWQSCTTLRVLDSAQQELQE